LDEVVAPSGLGNRDEELAGKLEPLPVDGGDIRRKGAHGNAEMALKQVFAERRRVGRASARAGQDEARRLPPNAAKKLVERSLQLRWLAPDRLGPLLPFRFHIGADVAHRDCLGLGASMQSKTISRAKFICELLPCSPNTTEPSKINIRSLACQ